MKLQRGHPKRLHARFRFDAELEASELYPSGRRKATARILLGKTENISTGGVCIRTKRPPESSRLLRCELRLPGTAARIAFLARVRWSEKRSGADGYQAGLQFVI
jgi:PilZ domain